MSPILDLRDIHGLDSISWWPPGSAWWAVLGAVLVLIWFAYTVWQRLNYVGWQRDARRQLHRLRRALRRNPDAQAVRGLVADYSELLRRVAMMRYGREQCAGLQGEAWLAWLEARDPQGFRWSDEARLLLLSPYAPPDTPLDTARLPRLLRAMRPWIEAELPQTQARPRYIPAVLWQRLPRRLRLGKQAHV